jgi:hypothetical protein
MMALMQFIPAQTEEHPGPWYILNALHILHCIDDARSGEVQYWKPEDNRPAKLGEYRAVHGLRIDPSRVGGPASFVPEGGAWHSSSPRTSSEPSSPQASPERGSLKPEVPYLVEVEAAGIEPVNQAMENLT